jgi:uncharacterized protein
MGSMAIHKSHPDVIKRLERAAGHLASVIEMLREGRDCLEVTQQLQAVESAIANAKKTLVHDHIDHCLGEAVNKGARGAADAVREFKQITRYL